jgi:DNA polymerase-3 subunit delta'
MTSLWTDLVGHDSVIAQMQNAADSPDTLTQSWLITGPAGSGRSLIARAFAAQLLGAGEDTDAVDRQVRALTHPDLTVLATERVLIPIDEVRELVETSYRSPVASSWRIIIIEDADRMAERTSNVLLKALEEPAARTIWILCAPSEADVIPMDLQDKVARFSFGRLQFKAFMRRIGSTTMVSAKMLNESSDDSPDAMEAARTLTCDPRTII